ncbi:MAG: glutaredoxin domain-containing protein [Deltaproteobacteria bacterium]
MKNLPISAIRPAIAACIAALCMVLASSPSSHGAAKQTIINPSAPHQSAYPKIVIYTVSWCPHCRELKEYLTSHNIPFINRDVELDPAAMERLTGKYSTFGVPVVVIGNDQEIIKGFTPAEFEQAVKKVKSSK